MVRTFSFRGFLIFLALLAVGTSAALGFEVKKGQAVSIILKNGHRIDGIVRALGEAIELEIIANCTVSINQEDVEEVQIYRDGRKFQWGQGNASGQKGASAETKAPPRILVKRQVEQPQAFLESLDRLPEVNQAAVEFTKEGATACASQAWSRASEQFGEALKRRRDLEGMLLDARSMLQELAPKLQDRGDEIREDLKLRKERNSRAVDALNSLSSWVEEMVRPPPLLQGRPEELKKRRAELQELIRARLEGPEGRRLYPE